LSAVDVAEMDAFIEFMAYLCEELKLDAYLYLNTLGEIMGIPPVTPRPSTGRKDITRNVGGVSGL